MLLPGVKLSMSPTDLRPMKQTWLQRFDGERWPLFGDVIDVTKGGGLGHLTVSISRSTARILNRGRSHRNRTDAPVFCFDGFFLREQISAPHQVRGGLPLQAAIGGGATTEYWLSPEEVIFR
jgi:hypothetical protein